MTFWAHSGTPNDWSDWQPLPDDLRGVSDRAREMADAIGLSRGAAVAGLLHDLGKYDPAFQRRVAGEDVRVDHSTAGGVVALDRAPRGTREAAERLAYAILGHHAGLPDRLNDTDACLDARVEGWTDRLDPAWQRDLAIDWEGVGAEITAKIRREPLASTSRSPRA